MEARLTHLLGELVAWMIGHSVIYCDPAECPPWWRRMPEWAILLVLAVWQKLVWREVDRRWR